MTAKQEARAVLDHLPDDASLDDVMYALYLKAKFERGLAEIKQGRGVTHAKAKKRLRKWLL